MPPESAKYLRDMLDAARAIDEHVRGRTADDYLNLRWLRDAVQWNFCVIGEALSQLDKTDGVTAQRLTDYAKIIAFRNQLITVTASSIIASPGTSSSASSRCCAASWMTWSTNLCVSRETSRSTRRRC
jgi:uncharacterized protein with HEPN domain